METVVLNKTIVFLQNKIKASEALSEYPRDEMDRLHYGQNFEKS